MGGIFAGTIAVALMCKVVVLYYLCVAAKFSECVCSFVFLKKAEWEKVIVYAFNIAHSLVKPAACLVYKSCFISFSDKLCNTVCVKLSPAFIKYNPCGD